MLKKIILLIILSLITLPCMAEEYKIDKGDVLVISVYDEPEMETKVRVDSKGNISFPMLDNISVSGLTINQIKLKIEDLLKQDYFVDPHVNIFIEEFHPSQVTIIGAVESPGKYDLERDKKTTFLEAVSVAGGFKSSASLNASKVMRKKEGKDISIRVKVTDITKRGKQDKDIEILPGDVIFIPDSFF